MCFPKTVSMNLDRVLPVKVSFVPKTKMVRMVHMNTLSRIPLQSMDEQVEFLTAQILFVKWPCSKFWECVFLEKQTLQDTPQTEHSF